MNNEMTMIDTNRQRASERVRREEEIETRRRFRIRVFLEGQIRVNYNPSRKSEPRRRSILTYRGKMLPKCIFFLGGGTFSHVSVKLYPFIKQLNVLKL